uniref:Uncharacterized protein n=1 Tax=Solanum tuberosum TaxID=4113 RepID=M1DDU3_SOLTU
MASPTVSSKKRISTSKQKASKKPHPLASGSLSPVDMQSQLKDSHCPVSSYLKVHKLSPLFTLSGLELFEEAVRLFYTNLRISPDSGELETLVLRNCIIVNELLFEDVFGTNFPGVISYMNGTLPEDFEVSLEGAKRAVAEPDSDSSCFGPLSLCFKNRILAHIVATTLISRIGSLSNISTRDVYILYCLLRKYCVVWFKEYMWESAEDTNASASLPYGLLISRILVDLSMFTPIVINASYDFRTFSSMGYVQVKDKWVKKDSFKARAETLKHTIFFADSTAILLQDNDELKTRLLTVERGLETLLDVVEKVFRLQKDTSTNVGKLRIAITGIKDEGISTVHRLIKQVGSLKSGVSSFNNDFAVTV